MAGGERRIAVEAALIAEADADIEAGRIVESAAVNAWIRSLGPDHEQPAPTPPPTPSRKGRGLNILS